MSKPLTLEITVISAQGLKTKDSSLFFPQSRLRPFITLTTNPPTIPYMPFSDHHHVYQTKVDTTGGESPSWGDKFQIPINNTFFSQRHSCIYLHIFTNPLRSWGRKCELGWCGIPATDIVEGFRPAGAVRHLSYRVRRRDGSRGHGVVNVAVKLSGHPDPSPTGMWSLTDPGQVQPGPSPAGMWSLTGPDPGRTAIGIPVEALLRLSMDPQQEFGRK
ncbi:hypothetical protein NE237_012414 [Protea cynaroides]|uniref:C2 domain-containing protein n=1 Tax=Protea cynaroides TaxID=273540 RepID=A0A9Q0GZ29_9MAGN|nr:hypothetical protein NE237_012414 [Protea cynaroides]